MLHFVDVAAADFHINALCEEFVCSVAVLNVFLRLRDVNTCLQCFAANIGLLPGMQQNVAFQKGCKVFLQ